MGLSGHAVPAGADEEIEVDPPVGLEYVVHEQPGVAPLGHSANRRRPGPSSERLCASSSPLNSTSSERRGTSRVTQSPERNSDSGPPTAASGATWSTTVP